MTCKVVAEFRPRLQACQFYIKAEIPPESTRLSVLSKSIILNCENILIEISLDNMQVIPDSVSGLTGKGGSFCFRVQTDSKSIWGSFKTEVLELKKTLKKSEKYIPPIELHKPLEIYCRCCSNKLSDKPITFNRLLPLPSSNLEAADLFCHQHDNDNLKVMTDPKQNDCLYGSYFIKLDASYLNKCETILHCSRCLSWLGLRERNSVQLWNSTISFNRNVSSTQDEIALSDFIAIVKEMSEEMIGLSCKILLQCTLSSMETHYLLLWVMEKNLQLLTSDEFSYPIILKENTVIKLLFKFETANTPMVNSWLKDIYTVNIEVSKQMLVEGLKHLQIMTSYIPEDYRITNEMYVSYIGMV